MYEQKTHTHQEITNVHSKTIRSLAITFIAASTLVGCGGGGSGENLFEKDFTKAKDGKEALSITSSEPMGYWENTTGASYAVRFKLESDNLTVAVKCKDSGLIAQGSASISVDSDARQITLTENLEKVVNKDSLHCGVAFQKGIQFGYKMMPNGMTVTANSGFAGDYSKLADLESK